MHGGQIEAESEGPGRGARFTVSPPATHAEHELSPPTPREIQPPTLSKRVLVVEDNQDVAETMAQLLQYAGHEVALAHDGPNALTKAEDFKPQVILLDIGLPGMDGYETAKRLRQHPDTSNVTLAALTGYGQAQDIERAQASGFDRHFTKPAILKPYKFS